jgi:hypothetical protein
VDRQGDRPGPNCLTKALAGRGSASYVWPLLRQCNRLRQSSRAFSFGVYKSRPRMLRFNKREFTLSSPMNALSPAHRVRSRFMSFGFWTSIAAFVLIEGDALMDQSEIGHASALFMFGTACLAAAACIWLFAIITAIGLAVSAAFRDEPHQQQSAPSQDAPAVAAASICQPLRQLRNWRHEAFFRKNGRFLFAAWLTRTPLSDDGGSRSAQAHRRT